MRQGTLGDTALSDKKERQDKATRMTHLLHFNFCSISKD